MTDIRAWPSRTCTSVAGVLYSCSSLSLDAGSFDLNMRLRSSAAASKAASSGRHALILLAMACSMTSSGGTFDLSNPSSANSSWMG